MWMVLKPQVTIFSLLHQVNILSQLKNREVSDSFVVLSVQLMNPRLIFWLKFSILEHLVQELCGPLKERAVISLISM